MDKVHSFISHHHSSWYWRQAVWSMHDEAFNHPLGSCKNLSLCEPIWQRGLSSKPQACDTNLPKTAAFLTTLSDLLNN